MTLAGRVRAVAAPSKSDAASIQWFHEWVETGDASLRGRILEYNEDDCRATRVLVDVLKDLART